MPRTCVDLLLFVSFAARYKTCTGSALRCSFYNNMQQPNGTESICSFCEWSLAATCGSRTPNKASLPIVSKRSTSDKWTLSMLAIAAGNSSLVLPKANKSGCQLAGSGYMHLHAAAAV